MHIDQLELTQLRLLEALAETGSVSNAAEAVGLSQSATSHSLSRLRALFDDPLFVRTSRGMDPTPYGAQIGTAVRTALKTLRDGFETKESFIEGRAKRTFQVYMSDVGQMVFLPRLLSHLKEAAPGVTLRVRQVPLRDQAAALESGEIDLAVGHFTSLTTGFFQRRLFRERYVCVARSDHPRFVSGMSEEAFQEVPHAIADASGMAHDLLEQSLKRHGIKRLIGLTVPQFMVLPLVIADADLLVTMPSRLAEEFAKLIRIQIMPLPFQIPGYAIKLFWHRRSHNDAANKWLRRVFVALFEDSSPSDPTKL